jgi:hypothetical protein
MITDRMIKALDLLEERTYAMETRLKVIEARMIGLRESKPLGTEPTVRPMREREGVQMQHGLIPSDVLYPRTAGQSTHLGGKIFGEV